VVYLASELGGERSIGGLAYQVTSGASGQVLSNFTIRLKATSQTALDYATGWDATGWTVVHRSNQILSSTGWVTFLFDTPFEYDGAGNLLVDLSFNNTAPTNVDTYWAADSVSTNRMLFGYTSIVGDPLLWAGTTNLSSNSNRFPKTRFLSLEPVAMGVSGATAVASGAWNGTASVPGYVDRVYLEAFDEAGRQGRSNPFTVAAPAAAGPPIPFNDGFESGSFSKAWSVSGTAAGRARVLSTNLPHTGAQHAVLDTASGYARAELTLTLDLTGYSGVSLSFWAKRFGGSDDGPPAAPFTTGADFDGVAMSADGAKWYEIQPLRAMTSGAWTQFTVNLDAAVAARALSYTAAFRIRFNQYGYDYAPYDGIAIDDVSVTGVPTARVRVTLPSAVREGDAPITGSVILPAAASSDTLVALISSSPFVLEVPSSVTVPAGQTTASFTATPLNNALLTGPIDVEITASAPGQIAGNASIRILDEEAATLALAIPSPVGEAGASVGATLSISPPAATTVNVALTSSLPELVSAPATVQIPPGAGNVTIPLTLLNNSRLNGSQSVTLTASVPGWTSVTRDFTVTDDESNTLTLIATSLIEGGSSTLSLYTGGTLPSDVVVTLTSSDPSRLSVPATVTIPGGASFVGISVTAANNTATDGMQSITVTASAPGMASGSAKVTVFDNDVHHFTFAGIGPAQVRGVPLPITLTARDVNERVITSFVGQVSLSASGDAGAIPCTPAMVSFTSGTWSGGVTMGSFSQNVRLIASDAAGHSGTSVPFDISRGAPTHYAWSPIVSPGVAGQSFPATITALDGGDNAVSGYSGYVKLSPVLPERSIGSGTSSTGGFPCNTSFAVERTQVIYAAGELGGAGAISALSLYFATTPSPALSNWTIRIKPTPLSSFSSASPWEDNDWTTVHSSTAVVTQTGWVTFPFTAPFAYDGANNLMVDFSFSNTTASYAASVRTFLASSPRTLYYASGSGNGDPRTWSGTTVPRSTSSTVPQVKLTMATPGMTVSPSVVLLSSGNWTGDLRLNAPATGLAIQAVDFSGRGGLSNLFTVQAAADTDRDGLPDAWELAIGLDSANATGDYGALGDPNGDGIPNILEYALNLNPHGFAGNGLPSSAIVANPADGQEYLEFTYRRRIGVPGITYVVETSGDAAVWTGDVSAYELVSGPLALGDGVTETVVVRVLPAVRTPGSPSRYARLRISAP
jgi:hypothetical protein